MTAAKAESERERGRGHTHLLTFTVPSLLRTTGSPTLDPSKMIAAFVWKFYRVQVSFVSNRGRACMMIEHH